MFRHEKPLQIKCHIVFQICGEKIIRMYKQNVF